MSQINTPVSNTWYVRFCSTQSVRYRIVTIGGARHSFRSERVDAYQNLRMLAYRKKSSVQEEVLGSMKNSDSQPDFEEYTSQWQLVQNCGEDYQLKSGPFKLIPLISKYNQADIHDSFVVKCSSIFLNLLHISINSQSRTIRTMIHHSFYDVDNRQDTGTGGNLFLFEPSGIAWTIHPFRVLIHHLCQRAERFHIFQDFMALLGVLFDQGKLDCKTTLRSKNSIRDTDSSRFSWDPQLFD